MKIIKVCQLNRKPVSDELIEEGLSEEQAKNRVAQLNASYGFGVLSDWRFRVVPDEYKLYIRPQDGDSVDTPDEHVSAEDALHSLDKVLSQNTIRRDQGMYDVQDCLTDLIRRVHRLEAVLSGKPGHTTGKMAPNSFEVRASSGFGDVVFRLTLMKFFGGQLCLQYGDRAMLINLDCTQREALCRFLEDARKK